MSRTLLQVFNVLVFLALAAPCAGESSIAGSWVLDEELSDDVEDAFNGKLRRRSFPTPTAAVRPGEKKSQQEMSQDNYWETIKKSRERRSMKNLTRLGTAYPLLTVTHLVIESNAGNFKFVYDDLLPRTVKPNSEGRIFSASGDELVADTIGHTLGYWEKDQLVLETDAPTGGKYIERLKLIGQAARLEYSIKVNVRALNEPVEVKRIFRRSANAAVK